MNKEKILSNICPIKNCGRSTHKESEYCIFHAKPEEKTEEEFKKALEKYIEKIKENNLDYNFVEFIFIGDIDFERDYKVTAFKNANFAYSTLGGSIFFINLTFKGYTDFSNVTFDGEIKFWSITFEAKADFRRVVFKKDTEFDGITFKGLTDFRHVIFEKNTDFERVTFKEDAKFDDATFQGNLSFKYANLSPVRKLNLRVKKKGIISFEYTFLENVYLNLDLDKGVLIDFTNSLLRNTKIERDQIENHILQEEKKEFSEAKQVYLLFKNNFHIIGRYDDESWAFKKEKDMERQNYRHFKSLHKWLWSCFLNGIFGYGEQPGKVIISAISIILIFTFLFMSSGISDTSIGGFTSNNFLDCVYFSVITFTTLGYGDFRPLEGFSRVFAGTEAFIGALMMALFVYTFARRTGGR